MDNLLNGLGIEIVEEEAYLLRCLKAIQTEGSSSFGRRPHMTQLLDKIRFLSFCFSFHPFGYAAEFSKMMT